MIGGAISVLLDDGMTRGPILAMPSVAGAAAVRAYLESDEGIHVIREAFNSTSRFARLSQVGFFFPFCVFDRLTSKNVLPFLFFFVLLDLTVCGLSNLSLGLGESCTCWSKCVCSLQMSHW